MKYLKSHFAAIVVLFVSAASFLPTQSSLAAEHLQTSANSQVTSPEQKRLLATFDKQVKAYVKQRELVRKRLPPLSKDATPEQIASYQAAFVKAMREDRASAKQGNLFSPMISDYIRTTLKTEFKGEDRAEVRKTILEADTQGVPLRVNYPYPDTKELTQIPPTLLLKLPQLPKELKYRFVGRNMLLVDTDNALIVDYMLNALP